MGLNMGTAEIEAELIQSGPISRDVYVSKSKNCHIKIVNVCKILNLTYEMNYTGRKCLLRVYNWLLEKERTDRENGVNQGFKRKEEGAIKLIVDNMVDEFLVVG